MTKKDFELIAGVLASAERVEVRHSGIGFTPGVEWYTNKFAEALKRDHPRFNAGTFEVAAMPIKHERLRKSILDKLGSGDAARIREAVPAIEPVGPQELEIWPEEEK